jgi:hypothetical protein
MCNLLSFNGERSVQEKGVNLMKEMKNEDKKIPIKHQQSSVLEQMNHTLRDFTCDRLCFHFCITNSVMGYFLPNVP